LRNLAAKRTKASGSYALEKFKTKDPGQPTPAPSRPTPSQSSPDY
jgi:hypothetical protein